MEDLLEEGLVDARSRSEEPPGLPTPQEVPDLELLVEARPGSGTRWFDLRLKARNPELDLNYRPVGSIELRIEPALFFRQQLAELWKSKPRTGPEWAAFAAQLRIKGAYLSETVLPGELRSRLASLHGRARTLLVQSDDAWIPWELLRIPEDPASDAADGPFLCEAFAMTRWIRGIRQTLFLPLRHIAVVVPRDCGLPQAEGECDDVLALARGEARRVDRIPARVSALREAFLRGDHDGWHFTGHGFHRDSAPDLSGIWLEEQEELTPVALSGEARRIAWKHPLVFLNACSSGQSGMSLTDIGGWAPHFLRAGAGVCLGALWPIDDLPARAFARSFYAAFLAGVPIAEAVFAARQAIRSEGNPTWLAYTLFAHPLAVCAPPPRTELPARDPAAAEGRPLTAAVQVPAPTRLPQRLRQVRTAAAGTALLLLLSSTRGHRAVPASRRAASGKIPSSVLEQPGPAAPRGVPVDGAIRKMAQEPAPAATRSAETAHPATRSPEHRSSGQVRGIAFRVDAGAGALASTLRQALTRAAEPLTGMGISGWTLDLALDAPRITTLDQDGSTMESCRLTAHGRARRAGTSLDLGPLYAVNSQFDRTIACEEAARALAEAAVQKLASSQRKGAT